MNQIDQIIEWNKIAENNTFDYHLANSMLSEEFSETVNAMKTWDNIEMLDWILDMFIIWIWELHKKWVTADQITKWLDLIIENNYSKFNLDRKTWQYTCIKDNNGKIMKPEGFKSVDLSNILTK